MSLLQQPADKVSTDKTAGARHEYHFIHETGKNWEDCAREKGFVPRKAESVKS
jgi:hypothetical protein